METIQAKEIETYECMHCDGIGGVMYRQLWYGKPEMCPMCDGSGRVTDIQKSSLRDLLRIIKELQARLAQSKTPEEIRDECWGL